MPPYFSAVPKSFRREAGMDGHALELTAGRDILVNKRVDKIPAFRLRRSDFLCHAAALQSFKRNIAESIIKKPVQNCKVFLQSSLFPFVLLAYSSVDFTETYPNLQK